MFGLGGDAKLSRLQREVRRLREDLDYLAGAVNRLRGRVTGGVRNDVPNEVDYEEDE